MPDYMLMRTRRGLVFIHTFVDDGETMDFTLLQAASTGVVDISDHDETAQDDQHRSPSVSRHETPADGVMIDAPDPGQQLTLGQSPDLTDYREHPAHRELSTTDNVLRSPKESDGEADDLSDADYQLPLSPGLHSEVTPGKRSRVSQDHADADSDWDSGMDESDELLGHRSPRNDRHPRVLEYAGTSIPTPQQLVEVHTRESIRRGKRPVPLDSAEPQPDMSSSQTLAADEQSSPGLAQTRLLR
ncbi:hypothetical protein LTR22_004157 [Elasticomyces elasticus]|nr:hypothetical protein LTR22_004157 [Elasticomyces elasticus]